MYDMKALYQAADVADAVALRLAHPEAQIIAGGSDVLVQMREGKRAGAELISIYGLDELRGVSLEEDGTLRLTCKTVTGETSFLRFDPEAWELTSDPGVLPGQTSDHDTAEDLWGAGGALRVFLFCEEK